MPSQPILYAPDIQQQQADLTRRQAIAQTLMQRGMNGDYSTQMAGNVAIQRSPLEGLANLASAYMGSRMAKDNNTESQKLAQAMQDQRDAQFRATYGGGQQAAPRPQQSLASALLGNQQPGDEASALIPQMTQPQAQPQQHQFVTGTFEGDKYLHQQNPEEYFKAWNAKNNPEFSTSPEYDEQGRAYVINKAGGRQFVGSKRQEEMVNDNGVLRSKYGITPLGVLPNVNDAFNPVLKDGVITAAPNMPVQNFQITKAVAGSPKQQTTVHLPRIEGSALIEGNKDFIEKAYRPLMTKAELAVKNNGRIESLRNISASSGWGTEAASKAANFLVGIGLGTEEAKAAATNAQTFNSIVSQQVYEGLNAATGPQTEGDAERYKQTLAQLGNTPDANQFILDSAKAYNNQILKQAKFYGENMPKARAAGDLTQVEQAWIGQGEKNSVWNDPLMAKWKKMSSGGAPKPTKSAHNITYNPKTGKWE